MCFCLLSKSQSFDGLTETDCHRVDWNPTGEYQYSDLRAILLEANMEALEILTHTYLGSVVLFDSLNPSDAQRLSLNVYFCAP